MKKHIIISIAIFSVVTALSLASNFIRWDETPLEKGIYALPLAVGLLLEMPFLRIMGLWIGDTTGYVNYELLWSVIPFVAGAFYATLYYFIVFSSKKFLKKTATKYYRLTQNIRFRSCLSFHPYFPAVALRVYYTAGKHRIFWNVVRNAAGN